MGLKVARTSSNFEIHFRLSNHNVPSGSSANPYGEPRSGEFTDGMDGWMDGWMDGVSKVSFNFLYTLCVYRSYM